jgi:hypothetical protein
MSEGQYKKATRSFVEHKLERGTAEKLRDQVKEAFSLPDAPQVLGPTLDYVGGSTFDTPDDSFISGLSVQPPASIDPVNPVDYEKFISENSDVIHGDSLSHLLLFPDSDISISTLPRKFRTIQYPVPGQAKYVIH